MAQEIERKFLVLDDSFKKFATSHTHIEQGYICSGSGRTVRVRIRGDKGYLTIKGPSRDGGLSRYEFETDVAMADAKELMLLCEPGSVVKERWLVPMPDGHTFEVDEFFNENEGLVMAEVELETPDATFLRPTFLGKEVTGDRRYYNAHLRRYPYRMWAPDNNSTSSDQQ